MERNKQKLSIEIENSERIHITEFVPYTRLEKRRMKDKTRQGYTARIAENMTKKQALALGILLIQAAR